MTLAPCWAISASRVGCTRPVSSVARLLITAGAPFHFQGIRNRVSAYASTGADRAASAQVCPPSAETSTLLILPRPDQAIPDSSYSPCPVIFNPGAGRVMTDFTSIGYVNRSDLPSAWRSLYFDVSSLVIVGVSVTLIRRSHFTLMLPS